MQLQKLDNIQEYVKTPIFDNIIVASTNINNELSRTILNGVKESDINEINDSMKLLKKLKTNINDMRIDAFRDITDLQSKFKSQIDTIILKPIEDKIKEYETKIKAHNKAIEDARRKALLSNTPAPAKQPEPIKMRERWRSEVIDFDKLPDKYKKTVVNQEMIDADVASGTRQIEGVKIWKG